MFKLDGFSEVNFEKVLKFYIDDNIQLSQIYSTIKQHKLEQIVSNPISMYLITKIISDDQVEFANLSSFGLLAIVFEKFYASKNVQLDENGNKKMIKIEETCHKLLMQSKFVFSQKDLVEGLTLEDFEKYVMVDASVTVSSYKHSIDEKRVVFCHQLVQVNNSLVNIFSLVIFYVNSVQEFLAARYVVYQKELKYFKYFIDIFVLSSDDELLFKWSPVRRFICTLLSKTREF